MSHSINCRPDTIDDFIKLLNSRDVETVARNDESNFFTALLQIRDVPPEQLITLASRSFNNEARILNSFLTSLDLRLVVPIRRIWWRMPRTSASMRFCLATWRSRCRPGSRTKSRNIVDGSVPEGP